MRTLCSWLTSVLVFALCASDARAEGMVQLTLHGAIGQRGGAPVELELGVWDGGRVRELSLNIHLGEHTGARDLAELLISRLRRMGARVERARDEGAAGPVHVFVESVTHVHLRLGHGMWGAVTLCDAAPKSLRMQQPEIQRGAAQVHLAATSFHPHDRRLARRSLSLELGELMSSAQISESLARISIEAGWVADRPTADRWAVLRLSDGSTITGCSVELRSPDADWRLEVQLEVPASDLPASDVPASGDPPTR